MLTIDVTGEALKPNASFLPAKDRTSLLGLILPTPEETHKVTGLPPLPPLPPAKPKPHSWSWEYYVQPVTFPKDLK